METTDYLVMIEPLGNTETIFWVAARKKQGIIIQASQVYNGLVRWTVYKNTGASFSPDDYKKQVEAVGVDGHPNGKKSRPACGPTDHADTCACGCSVSFPCGDPDCPHEERDGGKITSNGTAKEDREVDERKDGTGTPDELRVDTADIGNLPVGQLRIKDRFVKNNPKAAKYLGEYLIYLGLTKTPDGGFVGENMTSIGVFAALTIIAKEVARLEEQIEKISSDLLRFQRTLGEELGENFTPPPIPVIPIIPGYGSDCEHHHDEYCHHPERPPDGLGNLMECNSQNCPKGSEWFDRCGSVGYLNDGTLK